MNKNVLNNIKKAVSDVWIEVYNIFPNLLASPEWVLTKRQKELWVVCVDIWASTTWVTVYEEWVLQYSSTIPIGWDSVTNDIALWIRTSIDIAEKLKKDNSELSLDEKALDKEINLVNLWAWEEWTVSSLYLSKIVTARYEEILFFIRRELRTAWKDWMLPEWIILVWGWSKEIGLIDLAKSTLKLPAFIWMPVEKDVLLETSISDPVFAWVIWNMILANRYTIPNNKFSLNVWWIFASIIKIFKKILP
jgi:cell division protein FtsA